MKTLAATISLIAVSAMSLSGQGRVQFNNLVSSNAIRVGPLYNQGSTGGRPGDYVGANYSIQLLWAPVGVYANDFALAAAALGSSAAVAFFGTTGGSPTTDGAGYSDGGAVPNQIGISMPAGKLHDDGAGLVQQWPIPDL